MTVLATNAKVTLALLLALLVPFATFAQSDDDFFSEEAVTVTAAPTTSVDPTKQFSETADGLRWGGTVSSNATWNGGWVNQWPNASDPFEGWKDGLDYGLSTKLFLDGRPDKDFRFRLSLKTGYPFTNDTTVLNSASYVAATPAPGSTPSVKSTSTTLKIPNIRVWEMFTDVTVEDTLFLRFGKQSASWGASYFYSPGDVISLTAKDASDPTAEREGPVALKATLPFPAIKTNLTGFVLVRESYFEGELPSLENLGYALQADALVGDAQISLGGFYQRDNAPKAVATLNTGFGFLGLPVLSDVNLFSEAVLSYGSDVLRGDGTAQVTIPGGGPTYEVFGTTSEWSKKVYYTGTLGASYSNTDGNWSLRGEYLYNPFGYTDKKDVVRAYNTVMMSMAGLYGTLGGTNDAGRTFGFGDAATPGIHNATALFSLSKLGGSDKLSFSTLVQQNFTDGSGWVKPSFSFRPWDQLSFTWGVTSVYGDKEAQFPLTFQYRDKDGNALGPKRLTLNIGVTFGTGKY